MTAGVPPANLAAVIAGELASLATDAKLLAARLAPGDVVAAVVLPSNGLTDLLDIGGLRVAAELPPTLLPGQTIAVQVVDFTGDRINLHIIDTAPAENPTGVTHAPASVVSPVVQGRESAEPTRATATYPGFARPALPIAPAQKAIEARLAASHVVIPPAARPLPAAPGVVRPLIASRPPSGPVVNASAAAVTQRGPTGFTQPEALLRALRLPVTATNIAFARMALDAPQKLPSALAVLERALSGSADPRVASLSTLTSFIARLDPLSPVLPTQIAAFVDNVVTGSEAKLASFVEPFLNDALAPADPQRAAVARAALDYDLKTQLLALAADPPGRGADDAGQPGHLAGALAGALTAITAVQLAAVTTNARQPDQFAFSIPLTLPQGVASAHIRIDRDAPETGHLKLDGDNFHIAFILETRHFGSVVLDVSTVGRGVTLGVKAENAKARQTLADALDGLTTRLEHLRYRVVSADVVVAPPTPAPVPAATSPAGRPAATQHVDVDA